MHAVRVEMSSEMKSWSLNFKKVTEYQTKCPLEKQIRKYCLDFLRLAYMFAYLQKIVHRQEIFILKIFLLVSRLHSLSQKSHQLIFQVPHGETIILK